MSNHQPYGFNPSSDFGYMPSSSPSSTYSFGSNQPSSQFQNLPNSSNIQVHSSSTSNAQFLGLESLEMHDLMRNHHVLDLFNQCKASSASLVGAINHNNHLLKENMDLRASIDSQVHLRGSTTEGGRPQQYPESILWLERDCHKDPDVKISHKNPSRLPMVSVIRYEDGSLIDAGLYDALRVTGTMIIHRDLFSLPRPSDRQAKNATQTRSYFKKWHRREWDAAIQELEKEQPLLALCAASWKANCLLGSILASINQTHKTSSENEPVPSNKSAKRPRSPSQSSAPLAIQVPKKNKPSNDSNPISAATKLLIKLPGLSVTPSLDKRSSDSTEINVDFICISSNFHDLQEIFRNDYPKVTAAMDLLATMKAYPDFARQDPSTEMIEFLTRIETADPNNSSFDEDNSGPGWGHYQFTAGSLTCGSVIANWAAVGNTDIACRLIAASIRTAKVARYWCHEKKIAAPLGFVSDMYVDRVIDSLWDAWRATPGACTVTTVSKAPQVGHNDDNDPPDSAISQNTVTPVDDTSDSTPEDSTTVPHKIVDTEAVNVGMEKVAVVKSTEEILQLFQNKELKAWLVQNNIKLNGSVNKQRSNKELQSAITNSPDCPKPAEADLLVIIAARPKKKKTAP